MPDRSLPLMSTRDSTADHPDIFLPEKHPMFVAYSPCRRCRYKKVSDTRNRHHVHLCKVPRSSAYRRIAAETSVQGASPHQLVGLLYDALLQVDRLGQRRPGTR